MNRLVPEHYSGISDYALLTNKTVSDILFSRPLSNTSQTKGTSSDKFIANKDVYTGYVHNQYGFGGNTLNRNDFYLGAEAGSNKVSLGAMVLGSTGSMNSTYGNGSVDGVGGTVYARGALTPDFRVMSSVGYSNYNYNLNRSAMTGTTTATTSSDGINADLGMTYLAFNQNGYSVQPRIGVGYGDFRVNGFQENGAIQKLAIAGHNASRLSGQAGAIMTKDFEVARGVKKSV